MHLDLACHPDTPPRVVRSVTADMVMDGWDHAILTFHVAPGGVLALPQPASPERTDELWRHTCFELFLKRQGEAEYFEFNLSPSTQWAAYGFAGYRAGMRDLPLSVAPRIESRNADGTFALKAEINLTAIPAGRLLAGLSAVIEEVDGTKSYWALRHPSGQPDFHHADCLALCLPASQEPDTCD